MIDSTPTYVFLLWLCPSHIVPLSLAKCSVKSCHPRLHHWFHLLLQLTNLWATLPLSSLPGLKTHWSLQGDKVKIDYRSKSDQKMSVYRETTETQNLITESHSRTSQVRFNLDNTKYRKRQGFCLNCPWTHWVIIAIVILLLALITIVITWAITKAQYHEAVLMVPTDLVIRGNAEIQISKGAKFRTLPIHKRDLSTRNTLVHPLQDWSAPESQNWCSPGHSVCEELWKAKMAPTSSNCSNDHLGKLFQADLQTVMQTQILAESGLCRFGLMRYNECLLVSLKFNFRDESCRQLQICCLSHSDSHISFTFTLHISRTAEFPSSKVDNLQHQLTLAVPSIMDHIALVPSFEWLKIDRLRLCLLQMNLYSSGFSDCLSLSKCREISQNWHPVRLLSNSAIT